MISNPQRRSSGFTLIEVMMALVMMSIITGMVFGIAHSSLNMGKAIIDTQAEEMEQHAFYEFMKKRFATLPGNARLELISWESRRVTSGGSQPVYLSDMTLQNVPMNFTWGGTDQLAKAVQISTVQTRSGYLDIVLRYYEDEILEGSGSDFDSNAEPLEPYAEIVLLRDVGYFEWSVRDSSDMEWYYDWDQQGRLPLQIELRMAIGATGDPIRYVFWLPPKLSPEVVMRQMGGNPQNPPGGGGGDITIEVGSGTISGTIEVPEGGGE